MIDIKNKKKLQLMIFVFIGVITLGVGYAAISAVNLVISGNATGSPSQNSFSVVFKSASVTTGTGTATINNQDATIAYFDVSGLSKAGDTAVATYTIKNESNGVGASISLNVTNTNSEYFQVTESIVDTELQANEQTIATITVQMIKTPITDSVSTSITGTLTATPMENANATGSSSATATPVVVPQYKYSDSENTIGQALVGELPGFSSPSSIAHIVSGGVITESYLAISRNNTIYYLRGGAGNEFGQASMPIYDYNVNTLKEAFGPNWESLCSETVRDNYHSFYCYDVGLDIYADATTDGDISASYGDWYCGVYDDGGSRCGV